MLFISRVSYLKSYNLLEIDNVKYYRLGVTEKAKHQNLMYDFSLEYLSLNVDQYISLYGDNLFSLNDLEQIESNGGYYEDWCFENNP